MSLHKNTTTGPHPAGEAVGKPVAKYPFNFRILSFAPILMLLLATFYWGTGNVAQNIALGELSPIFLTGLRSFIALMFLGPFAINECRKRELDTAFFWRNRACLILPVISFGCALALQTIGGAFTTATNVGFLVNMGVLMTPLFLWIFYQQRPSNFTLAVCGMCMCGISLFTGSHWTTPNSGDMICLSAAVFYSLWVIGLQRAQEEIDAPITLTALQFVLPAIIGLSINVSMQNVVAVFTWPTLPAVIYLGVFSSGVAFLMATIALRHVSPILSVMIYSFEAIFGALAAYFILDERMQTIAIVGAGIMIASVVLMEIREIRERQEIV